MTTINDTLRPKDLFALTAIVNAVERHAHVAYVMNAGYVVTGTLRGIGDAQGNSLGADEDVRRGYVRITTPAGIDVFRPLREIAEQYRRGELFVD